MLMRLGRRVAIVVRLSSILALDLTPQHGMEVVFLIGKQEQHLRAHDADADTRVQRSPVSPGQMAIIELQAVAAVDCNVPLLVRGIKVNFSMYTGNLALRAKVNVYAPVLALCIAHGHAGEVSLGAVGVGAAVGVYTTDPDLRVLHEEAPVTGSNLCKGGNVLALVALGLEVVGIVDGGGGGICGGAESGNDHVLALDGVHGIFSISSVGERRVGVVTGNRLGDAGSGRVFSSRGSLVLGRAVQLCE